MSYVLDMRELVHKLPFHHFSAHGLKNSCIGIAFTYGIPGIVGAGVSLAYYRQFTLKNKTIFENTNIKEAKTRAIITGSSRALLVPAANDRIGGGISRRIGDAGDDRGVGVGWTGGGCGTSERR